MKLSRLVPMFTLLVAATFVQAQSPAQKSFNQLRELDGSWSGKNSQGMPLKVVFQDTANGSAILSEILDEGHAGHENMVTMFHLDNGRLMMTHYCGAGNQPRMVASTSPDGKVFTFNFVDGTNIPTPESGHMQRLVITMADADHHTEDWTFVDHGKEMKEVFTLERGR